MAYTNIDDPSAHFQVATYTGNGSSQNITNDGNSDLKPDLIWTKQLDANSTDHVLANSSIGFNAPKGVGYAWENGPFGGQMATNSTGAESTPTATYGYASAALTDGFTVSAGGTNADNCNKNTKAFVGWQWKANGGTTTSFSESGNNPGGTRQTNVDAGFSIITYTGTGANASCQLAHGLGKAPEWIIFKRREAAQVWAVWHKELGDDYKLVLNALDGKDADGAFMNSTLPDATNIYVGGTSVNTNANNGTYNCYAWTSIQGYSKFGKYTGSGDADGPFVYTGFKPAYVLIKPDTANNHWVAMDTTRDEYNGGGTAYIFPNANEAQQTSYERMDFLSNGFKLRTNGGEWNGSGRNILYMAFAENPFVTSTGVPVTAR